MTSSVLSSYSTFPYSNTEPEKSFDISSLEEKDLAAFFASKEIAGKLSKGMRAFEISQKNESKSIDYIHFIWMGNPIKESDKKTILSWKEEYPSKQIILWVDQKALQHKDIIDFAQTNDIKLIDLDDIFCERTTFGLDEFIQLEKNRLPPNWGAISDMYRYLIMYYFGGTYSDTDSPISKDDTKLDFEKDFAFESPPFFGLRGNDRIMTKNIRNDFWKIAFDTIIKNYETQNPIKSCRLNNTIYRTGPNFFTKLLKELPMKNVQDLMYNEKNSSNYSWKANLKDIKKCENLAKEPNIIKRIVDNILLNFKDSNLKILDLQKYDSIIAQIPEENFEDTRKSILKQVNAEIIDNNNISGIKCIFAKTIVEHEEFANLLKIKKWYPNYLSYEEKGYIKLSYKKALKIKNIEMFKYLFKHFPEVFFEFQKPITPALPIFDLVLQLDNEDIFSSILNYAKDHKKDIQVYSNIKNESLDLPIDLDFAINLVKQMNKYTPGISLEAYNPFNNIDDYPVLHSICMSIYESYDSDKLKRLEKFLEMIPMSFFSQKDSRGRNIYEFLSFKQILRPDLKKIRKVIEKAHDNKRVRSQEL